MTGRAPLLVRFEPSVRLADSAENWPKAKKRETLKKSFSRFSGEGGIRTPDAVTRIRHFQCRSFSRSDTSPNPPSGRTVYTPNRLPSDARLRPLPYTRLTMGLRNKRPDLNGLLVINKPLHWTSSDVCSLVRARSRGARVGHAGTLDPLASGVLVLCLGRATKLIQNYLDSEKRYLATIDLSRSSPTDDLEAEPTSAPALADRAFVPPDTARIDAVLRARFTGVIQQTPPAHSAVWVDGERAYRLARAGRDAGLRARPVTIHSIAIVEYAFPLLTLDVRCGKGTYIRSIARDLGPMIHQDLRGVLTALTRTAVGPFTIEQAVGPDALRDRIEPEDLLPMPASVPVRSAASAAQPTQAPS